MAFPIQTVFMPGRCYTFHPAMGGTIVVPVGVEIHARPPNRSHRYNALRAIPQVVDIQVMAMAMIKPGIITGIPNLPIDDIATRVAITITVINGGKR
jgi:hypothetical protein